jgi:hypothetical protein
MNQNEGKVPINQTALDNPPDWHRYKSDRNQAIFILAFLAPMYLWVFWGGVTPARIIMASFLTGFILLMAWIPFKSMLEVSKNRPNRVVLTEPGLIVEYAGKSPQEYNWSDVKGVLVPYSPTMYSFMGKTIELHGMLVFSTGSPLKVTYQIAKEVSESYKARFGVYPAKYAGEWGKRSYYKALQK